MNQLLKWRVRRKPFKNRGDICPPLSPRGSYALECRGRVFSQLGFHAPDNTCLTAPGVACPELNPSGVVMPEAPGGSEAWADGRTRGGKPIYSC